MYNEELQTMDWKRLRMFTGGDAEETKELIDLFTEHAEEALSEMYKLCSDEADENWRLAVHKLKGSAANLGADVLAKLCKEAEKKWSESYIVKQAAVEDVVQEYAVVRKLLENPVLEVKNEDW